jgi:diadenosine tetraphosphate (Ap4A) HIT family hydrolase
MVLICQARKIYNEAMGETPNCVFCNIDSKQIVFENELAYVKLDKYPVSKGHSLVIPKRHIKTFFEATAEEVNAIRELLHEQKQALDKNYNPDGYNLGTNCGETAGQEIMHMHIHLIPRYKGDVANPRGGIRSVIPEKNS